MKLKSTYMIILGTIVGLVVLNQLTIQYYLDKKRDDALVINVAGRQRMLSQRVNQLAYRGLHGTNVHHQNLEETIEEWKNSHLSLMGGLKDGLDLSHAATPLIIDQLKDACVHIENIEETIAEHHKVDGFLIRRINHEVDLFLPKMEAIVQGYEEESEKVLSLLINLELVLALITIVIITIEIRFVFLPSYRKLIFQGRSLDQIAWVQSHEVRQQVANILGLSRLLKDEVEAATSEQQELLNHIETSAEKLDQITKKIIDNAQRKKK